MLDRVSMMDRWGAAVLVLVLAGMAAVVLTKFLNGKAIRAANSARRSLKLQADALPSHDISSFLKQCGLAERDEAAGHVLLQFLADLLTVSPDKLARDYPMRQLFSFSPSVVSKNDRLSYTIEPFTCEMVDGIAKLTNKQLWERRWKDTPGLPRDERKLADFIMQMTVPDLLRFFAPLLKIETEISETP